MLSLDANHWRAEAKADLKRMLEAVKYEGRAKNVIIFVGDGMGIQTHTMARIYKVFLTSLTSSNTVTIRVSCRDRQGRRASWPGRPSPTPALSRPTTLTTRQETGTTLMALYSRFNDRSQTRPAQPRRCSPE